MILFKKKHFFKQYDNRFFQQIFFSTQFFLIHKNNWFILYGADFIYFFRDFWYFALKQLKEMSFLNDS